MIMGICTTLVITIMLFLNTRGRVGIGWCLYNKRDYVNLRFSAFGDETGLIACCSSQGQHLLRPNTREPFNCFVIRIKGLKARVEYYATDFLKFALKLE